jgi:hypothetical protein
MYFSNVTCLRSSSALGRVDASRVAMVAFNFLVVRVLIGQLLLKARTRTEHAAMNFKLLASTIYLLARVVSHREWYRVQYGFGDPILVDDLSPMLSTHLLQALVHMNSTSMMRFRILASTIYLLARLVRACVPHGSLCCATRRRLSAEGMSYLHASRLPRATVLCLAPPHTSGCPSPQDPD